MLTDTTSEGKILGRDNNNGVKELAIAPIRQALYGFDNVFSELKKDASNHKIKCPLQELSNTQAIANINSFDTIIIIAREPSKTETLLRRLFQMSDSQKRKLIVFYPAEIKNNTEINISFGSKSIYETHDIENQLQTMQIEYKKLIAKTNSV